MKTLILLLASGALPLGATAQECRGDRTEYRNQDELNDLTQDCTTLTNDLRLVNYDGSLELPSITNLTGLVALNSSVTSASFPDLESISDHLDFHQVEGLSNASFPKLQYAQNITLQFANEASEIVFPQLTNLSSISVSNAPGLSFPSLRNISESFDLGMGNQPDLPNNETTVPIDLSFPILESVGEFRAVGNVGSLSVPNLTTAKEIEIDIYSTESNTETELSFPSLTGHSDAVSRFDFRGSITSLSMPALSSYSSIFNVFAQIPMRIDLGVRNLRRLEIRGEIESINLPRLSKYDNIVVSAWGEFDCDAFVEQVERTTGSSDEDQPGNPIKCSGGPALVSGGFAGVVAVAIGVYLIGALM